MLFGAAGGRRGHSAANAGGRAGMGASIGTSDVLAVGAAADVGGRTFAAAGRSGRANDGGGNLLLVSGASDFNGAAEGTDGAFAATLVLAALCIT